MNPILSALNLFNSNQAPVRPTFNGTPEDAKNKVLSMIDSMNPQQKASFSKMLPVIGRIAQAKGVDTSALAELQSRM